MMAEIHPTEIELLDYVEGDVDTSASGVLRAHVEACSACSATVAELERARATLRGAPLLELPATRADAMLRRLPRQEPDRPTWFEQLRSPRRLALVLAPTAALAAAVVAIVVVAGNGDEAGREAAPPPAVADELKAEAGAEADSSASATEAAPLEQPLEEAAPLEEPAPPAAEPPAEEATGGPLPVATLAGQPEAIAKILRQAGFTVQVDDGVVTVAGAPEADVAKALEDLPAGDDVPVFVEP
jgi:anti-sigma factor RsiW